MQAIYLLFIHLYYTIKYHKLPDKSTQHNFLHIIISLSRGNVKSRKRKRLKMVNFTLTFGSACDKRRVKAPGLMSILKLLSFFGFC